MKSLYLVVNGACLSVPLLASFHPRIQFYKSWPSALPAIVLAAIPFLIWDRHFTEARVWGFSPDYTIGHKLSGLPIEEILFFLCIPYACVFTYFCFRKFSVCFFSTGTARWIDTVLLICSLVTLVIFYERAYTGSTAASLAAALVLIRLLRPGYMPLFYSCYTVILLPFLISNGVLTGAGIEGEVVWYNNTENLGVRLGTIPVEDFFYGLLLILLNVALFEFLEFRKGRIP